MKLHALLKPFRLVAARIMPVFGHRPRQGSALLICLAFVALMTLLVISFLVMARVERTTSNLAMDRVQAELLADFAADTAVEKLREAIDSGRVFNASYFTTWASEPGRIHIFKVTQGTGDITHSEVPLFSAMPGADSTTTPNLNNIDLNEASLSGIHPITGKTPGTMKVGWNNILADPSKAASASNTIVGRIAYWVDDESCKININTADGSHKNDTPATQNAAQKYSYGFGVPSEISLQALDGISSAALADTMATYAATNNFNSISEAGQVAGVPSDFLARNKFSITHSSRSPDLNMWGEPRIHLFPVNRLAAAPLRVLNWMLGPYGGNNVDSPSNQCGAGTDVIKTNVAGGIVDHIYPTSKQLPLMVMPGSPSTSVDLPQHAATTDTIGNSSSTNWAFGMRIARYLQGYNSQGQTITWPKFPGANVNGFAGKYSLRQIDSITLQIADVVTRCIMPDQFRGYSLCSYLYKGFLSGEMVSGTNRNMKLTEVNLIAEAIAGSIPQLKFTLRFEYYFPKYYEGAPLDYFGSAVSQWRVGSNSSGNDYMNRIDAPVSELGTLPYWHANQLRFLDQNGVHSGIDMTGYPKKNADGTSFFDLDQPNAAIYHPYLLDTATGKYTGANVITTDTRPAYQGASPFNGDNLIASAPGIYSLGIFRNVIARSSKPGITSFVMDGGISFTSHNESGGYPWEIAPMDALRGPDYSGEAIADIKTNIMDGVIPVNFVAAVPSKHEYSLRVADPLVNKFPGDWLSELDPAPSHQTWRPPNSGNSNARPYQRGGTAARDPYFTKIASVLPLQDPIDLDGDNPEFKPSGGGDPLSLWLPRQDLRIPKQSRFPSVGALNTIRTGMIPDNFNTGNLKVNKGTPWRCLCFDASTGSGQATSKGSYPDWAMLDLFTVPFMPQAPETLPGAATTPSANPKPFRKLTTGGSTEGRLNINNPRVPYPFAETAPGVVQSGPERTTPLQALFLNTQISRNYQGNSDPIYETLSASDALTLANAVNSYLSSNGPFMLPGQLANVPEVAAYTYRGVAANAQTRNDLMAKVVGATTTQSNTFSIWVVTQTIKKAPQNPNYDIYEPGDTVTGEVRRRYLVERLIEPGKDFVPGNIKKVSATATTTNDGVLNTADDLIYDDFHPAMTYPLPYRWRILSVEDVVR
ncbi:MAG TPA: hypothetical protein VK970_23290 [Candidatus Methylacidiphilales bacterium]|nr:hypothetical protein [Candidatus Methylacidiphilales bacterium]